MLFRKVFAPLQQRGTDELLKSSMFPVSKSANLSPIFLHAKTTSLNKVWLQIHPKTLRTLIKK